MVLEQNERNDVEMRFTIKCANKIKVVVWDLDETFWSGTLSENGAEEMITPIQKNCDLVRSLTDRGIINAICSKNDNTQAEKKLKELGVRDYFVFNSINWEPKGGRLKTLITKMALRPENVLFIDDNPSNLGEAEFVMPEIMVASPGIIDELCAVVNSIGKDDTSHTRLKQYKVLEKKESDAEAFQSNDEFLRSSGIKICIEENVEDKIERIHELIQRSNQLNFTKKRISKEELVALLKDPTIQKGCVSVSDNYGKYGIVGFYAVRDNCLEHFLFSCRTMGMGIEQYVYAFLNYPILHIVAPVSGTVSREHGMPDYIEKVDALQEERVSASCADHKVLMKGPCDLEVLASYLEDNGINIIKEFNYIDDNGNQMDFYNHSVNIINSFSPERDKIIAEESKYAFISESAFDTSIINEVYDVICISPLMDATLGVYRNKKYGFLLPFGLYNKSITDHRNYSDYIDKRVMTARSNFTERELLQFSDEYERIEFEPAQIADNYLKIVEEVHSKYPDTRFLIMLLSELKFISKNADDIFEGKELAHKAINSELRDRFGKYEFVDFLDVNKYISKQDDYYDNINHYSNLVYYKMAVEFAGYLHANKNITVKTKSRIQAITDNIKTMAFKYKKRYFK